MHDKTPFNHIISKGLRLKKVNIPYTSFEYISNECVDTVDLDNFNKNETTRLPLLYFVLGKFCPMKIDFEEFFKEERIAAVLHIWYLSGNIHCCEIYRFPENFNYTKITYPCDLEKFRIKHSDNFWLDYRKMLTENFNHFNDKHLIRELTKQIGISHLGKAQKTLYTNHLFAEMRNRFDMSEFHKDILELSRKVFLQDVITVFLLGEKVYKKYKFEEN